MDNTRKIIDESRERKAVTANRVIYCGKASISLHFERKI